MHRNVVKRYRLDLRVGAIFVVSEESHRDWQTFPPVAASGDKRRLQQRGGCYLPTSPNVGIDDGVITQFDRRRIRRCQLNMGSVVERNGDLLTRSMVSNRITLFGIGNVVRVLCSYVVGTLTAS